MDGGYVGASRSVGALVGKSWGTIENCHNLGVTVYCSDSKGVGGIVGASWVDTLQGYTPLVINCSNAGRVSSSYTTGVAGGIVGENEGPISNCWNKGYITANRNAGGIAGSNQSNEREDKDKDPSAWGGISNCFNLGDIGNASTNYAGGIAGYNIGSVENCYNDGDGTQIIGTTKGQIVGQWTGSGAYSNLFYDGSGIAAIGTNNFIGESFDSTDSDSLDDLLDDLDTWATNKGGNYKHWTRDMAGVYLGGLPYFVNFTVNP